MKFTTGCLTAALGLAAMAATSAAHAASFKLSSPDIKNDATIKAEQVFNSFGCTGNNISPELNWSGAPAATKSFAVTIYDPDAPTGSGFWHWLIANIPASTTSLPKNAGDPKADLARRAACRAATTTAPQATAAPARRRAISRIATFSPSSPSTPTSSMSRRRPRARSSASTYTPHLGEGDIHGTLRTLNSSSSTVQSGIRFGPPSRPHFTLSQMACAFTEAFQQVKGFKGAVHERGPAGSGKSASSRVRSEVTAFPRSSHGDASLSEIAISSARNERPSLSPPAIHTKIETDGPKAAFDASPRAASRGISRC